MQKLKYIELGDSQSQSSQNEDLFSKRSDEMKDYLEHQDLAHNSKLVFQDVNRQLFEVELKKDEEETTKKILLYVRYLEQLQNYNEMLSNRSIKLQAISSKYLLKFLKYDVVQDDNLPLVVQHLESNSQRQPFSEIYKGSIPIDHILKILKRLIKIVTYLHQQGISQLDLNERNFEIDSQSQKPILIGIPLCAKQNISEMEACFQDFQELGQLMLKFINNSNATYANELSFEQMRLKTCVLQICQEFIQCRQFKKGIHEFVVKQMNRLTCIKQICKSISQSVEQISVQSFIPQRKTQEEFHKQIEALEIEILGSIPEHYQNNQSFEVKSCKDRWKNQIICSVTSLFIVLVILFFWKQSQNPFECIRVDESLYCKVNLEKQGFLFQDIELDIQVRNLTIDFSNSFINADKIISLLSKIQPYSLQYFMIDLQNNDVSKEGLLTLFQYLQKYRKAYEVKLNLVNTTLDNEYFAKYQNNTKEAYLIIDDLIKEYELVKQKIAQFSINSNFSSYFNAALYIQNVDNTQQLGNYIYLKNYDLKDEEFYYIFEKLFKVRSQRIYVDINLEENQIDGSSLAKIMKNFINKQPNITSLNLKFSYNPIKMEHFQQIIQLIQENNNLVFADLEFDLNPFNIDQNEFLNLIFFKKNKSQKLESFNIKIVQPHFKNLYQISKYLVSKNLPFGIDALVSNFSDINEFQRDFPLNQEYCQAELPQRVQNSKIQIHKMEIKTQQSEILTEKSKFNFKICQDQKQIEESLQTSLLIKVQKQFLQKSIRIFDDKQSKNFFIDINRQEFISNLQNDMIINTIQPQNQNEFKFKQFIFEGYHISDLTAQNIVELIKNNKHLNEVDLSAEFSTISQNSIKLLLSVLYSEENIKQSHLSLHQSILYDEKEYQQISQQQEIVDLVAESIAKSKNLLELHISYETCNLAAFNPIFNEFKSSNQLKNLTVDFNTKNITELELRNFYYTARSFKDEGKNLKTFNLIHQITDFKKIYFVQKYYEQILFEMRENNDDIQIIGLDELSELMIQDFIDEIKNFKTKQLVLNFKDEIKNEQVDQIFSKISENSYIQKLSLQSQQLQSSKISCIMSNLSKSLSITNLSIIIVKQIDEVEKQNTTEQSIQKIIKEMKNLQILFLECNSCFKSEKSFQKVVDLAYQSQNLQGINLIDNDLILGGQTYKRIALIQALSEKEKFFKIPQQYQQTFQEYLKQFTNNDKQILDLVYTHSGLDESLLLFLNNYIKKYQSSLKKINIEFNQNNITNNEIHILSKAIQNLNDLQEIKINLQNNKISNEGCNALLSSFASQTHIKNFYLNLKDNDLVEFECLPKLFNLLQSINEIQEISLILPNINENSFTEILNNLQNKQQLRIILIDVDELLIKMKEAKLIGSKFGKQQNLNSFTIKGQFERVIQSYFKLQKLQQANNTEFDLDFSNTFQYYESIEEIFQQLNEVKAKPQKLVLDFSLNSIQDDSVHLIGSYIEKNIESITDLEINLSNNPIYDEGISELSKILQKAKILTNFTLDVKNTNISFNFLNSILELKENNQNIYQIILKLNNLDAETQKKAEKLFSQYKGVQLILNSN
ncbi:transmembrane protein, putative (macronuclear) [Tetrahymena thermophila SB210]|uniref:Transmembrane protein, putative n=1 Tax=Tetrahymena thermophila (strain SB210) TaxID=312017 RepID=Q22L45_TETTS|nr:transmembrane protein, putative [Tetrahymena thermophila SB210]EAR85972.1 transmembrane protein, putative [Tetrahymena thermophila SB210]|eukprot:XP_976567.1 transmembrane protein, putative [Tetrahymena thermophila SB210]